jgi:ribosomal 50S subunit-associated protein YjgA (DUF615 family)
MSEGAIERAEALLQQVERARQRLEETGDPEAAIEVLSELAELTRQVEAEIVRAKREAEAEADAEP